LDNKFVEDNKKFIISKVLNASAAVDLPATAPAAAASTVVLSLASGLSLFAVHVLLSAAAIAYHIFLTVAVFARPASRSSGSAGHYIFY
jgi:hypothetical protein